MRRRWIASDRCHVQMEGQNGEDLWRAVTSMGMCLFFMVNGETCSLEREFGGLQKLGLILINLNRESCMRSVR